MINLDKALEEGGYKAKMLLQVHDEIVLEVPKAELAAIKKLVTDTMQSAIQLSVPLIADENDGETWYEAKWGSTTEICDFVLVPPQGMWG